MFQSLGKREPVAYAQNIFGDILLSVGRLEEAVTAYTAALTLYREQGDRDLASEPQAGLARVALAENNLPDALAHIEAILAYLADDGLLEGQEPLRILLTCYQVLAAVDDPRAAEVLGEAYARLQERAARISDKAMRRSFLENVPHHRKIVAAWEAAQPG